MPDLLEAINKLHDRVLDFVIELKRRRLVNKFGGIQQCVWCRQCAQDKDGWNFKTWNENPGYDVLTCGVCGGTSLWFWGMGMHFVKPLDPPAPLFSCSEVKS